MRNGKRAEHGQPVVLSAKVLAALKAGRKLDAVKTLRIETGLALTEALERVEAHIAADRTLTAEFARQREAMRGRLRAGVLLAAVLVAVAAWIVFG